MCQRVLRARALAAVTTLLVVSGIAGCGGGTSKGLSGDVIARVGSAEIARATLNHWMATVVGGDYFQVEGTTVPAGLVSDPANYAGCVASLKAYTQEPPGRLAQPSSSWLMSKCVQLQKAVKLQALEYLIKAAVVLGRNAEAGMTVTTAEVDAEFRRLRTELFPTDAELRTYLAERRWSLADELFLVKKNLLTTKLRAKIEEMFASHGGFAAVVNYSHAAAAKWTAKTDCRAGYVTVGCKQDHGAELSGPSPNVLLEAVARFHKKSDIKTAPDIKCKNDPKVKGGVVCHGAAK
jgi:hypothetical protein